LFTTFPLIVLAADGLVRVADIASGGFRRLAQTRWSSPQERRFGALVLGCALAIVVGVNAPLLVAIDTVPAVAAIPAFDHYQYFEQWFALYGLGSVSEYLKDQARETSRQVTVLVPPPMDRYRPR